MRLPHAFPFGFGAFSEKEDRGGYACIWTKYTGALCWALTWNARPIEIVMHRNFYFDFHVSDAYAFAQLSDV